MTKDDVFMILYVFPCTKKCVYQISFDQELPFSGLTLSDALKDRDFEKICAWL